MVAEVVRPCTTHIRLYDCVSFLPLTLLRSWIENNSTDYSISDDEKYRFPSLHIILGKRPWKPEIKERDQQLVNTLAKTEEKMDNRQTGLVWRIRLEAEDTALSRRRSRVRIPYALPSKTREHRGGMSLGHHLK